MNFKLISLLLFSLFLLSSSLPLSTRGRWIIDGTTGKRVKLMCGNWPNHLQPMLAEGLDKQPLKHIVAKLIKYKFNCVRLTWPIYMITRYADDNIAQTFDALGLDESKKGIVKYNPLFLNMSHVQAFEAVVDELGRQGVMIDIDNHISKPKWCCSETDDNGFPGDSEFDAQEWLQGLRTVAKLFKNKPQVIGMGIRNEPRGYRSYWPDWYNYIHKAAKIIHQENPNLLIFVGGLSYTSDLTYLKTNPLNLQFGNKLVYEGHMYGFSDVFKNQWLNQPTNRVCASAIQWFHERNGFIIEGQNASPLFMSEFGFDQRGTNDRDNMYLSCILAYLAEKDMDWALWAFQGSYYLRENTIDLDETYGIMNHNWTGLRNPTFPQRFKLIQSITQDANSNQAISYIIFHPQSGYCVLANNSNGVYLGDCDEGSHTWSHGGDGSPILLIGNSVCLKTIGDGHLAKLTTECLSQTTSWKIQSTSNLHLVTMDQNGQSLCLQKKDNSSNSIITTKCICSTDDSNCMDDPGKQWFKFVPTNIKHLNL